MIQYILYIYILIENEDKTRFSILPSYLPLTCYLSCCRTRIDDLVKVTQEESDRLRRQEMIGISIFFFFSSYLFNSNIL